MSPLLGVRIALAGGRQALARTALMTAGVAVGAPAAACAARQSIVDVCCTPGYS